MNLQKRIRSHFDWPLLGVVTLLLIIGAINLQSATYNISQGGISPLVGSQLLWMGIGFCVGFLLLFPDYRVFISLSYPFYLVSLGFLLLVVFFGKTVGGNRSWLELGPLTFQPSELAKLALVFALARFIADHPPAEERYCFRELILPSLLVLIPLVLIVLGRDMGSALFFLLAGGSLFLFVGIQRKILILLVGLILVGGVTSYKFVLSPHQRSRIVSFLNPTEDVRGAGYHLLQSKITVGSGRLLGKGYLKGLHSKLQYLPERHTDFIFPVLAEEWGFVGSLFLFILYALFFSYGIQIASKAKERFGVFLGLGIVLLFFWQVAINLGGVLGLVPLTGVTLPFLSYGGSSLVVTLMGVALLLNISMRRFMF